jgi:peptidoglycan/LPS O-acetylase OafA/YrhL
VPVCVLFGLSCLQGKKQPNPVALFFTYVLERWLRLTPAYAFVLVFYMYVIPRIMTGPQASAHVDDGQPPESNGNRDFLFCQHYVWTNLLYISNLFPLHDGTFESHYGKQGAGGAFGLEDAHGGMGCMGHSWYLSNDFQMHLLLPWILVAFRKHALLAYTGIAALIIFNWSYLGYIVAEFHWSLGCSDRGFEGSQNSLYYAKPWCRMSSFLVGVLMALYQTQHVTRSGHLPPPGLLLMGIGYVVALGIMFVCVFTPYWDTSHDPDAFMSNECQWSHAYDTIYSIVCRTAWGASICWLIFASLTCQGGPITRFLSWSFWTPFARLTYCWYLLHPLLMGVIYFAMPDGDDYYDLLGVAFYCFNTLIGLLCAAVVFFLVEMPFSNLKLLCMPAIYKGLGQLARRVSGVGSRRGGGGDGSRSAIPSFA